MAIEFTVRVPFIVVVARVEVPVTASVPVRVRLVKVGVLVTDKVLPLKDRLVPSRVDCRFLPVSKDARLLAVAVA